MKYKFDTGKLHIKVIQGLIRKKTNEKINKPKKHMIFSLSIANICNFFLHINSKKKQKPLNPM